jgi:hypothetical protein
MKLFLSHSTKDKEFVETLAGELRANSIDPWWCEVDIEHGDDFVAKIDEGLKESDLVVLVLSPDAVQSAWTRREWTAALAREVEESRIRLGVAAHEAPVRRAYGPRARDSRCGGVGSAPTGPAAAGG